MWHTDSDVFSSPLLKNQKITHSHLWTWCGGVLLEAALGKMVLFEVLTVPEPAAEAAE